MTGRALIVYILQNGLEDEPVFKNGRFIGFMTAIEAAEKMNVGVATILTWAKQGDLSAATISDEVYIPADSISPIQCKNGGQ